MPISKSNLVLEESLASITRLMSRGACRCESMDTVWVDIGLCFRVVMRSWVEMPESIDWSKLADFEKEDTTSGSKELACTAGVCEMVDIEAS